MDRIQANILGTPAHLLVQIIEATNTPESADDIAKCTLAQLIFDCWIIPNDVGEDGAKTNLRQHLADQHLLAIIVFQFKSVL